MAREELEQQVYDIVSGDKTIQFFHSKEWIRAGLKELSDEDLMDFLYDVWHDWIG